MKHRATFFGSATVYDDGRAVVTADGNDTYNWAHKAGAVWPCSALSSHSFRAEFNAAGDLVDYDGPDDVGADELNAICTDLLGFVVEYHPAMR